MAYHVIPGKTAHYHCLHCHHEWWWYPGPIRDQIPNICPRCGGDYFRWLDYSEEEFPGWERKEEVGNDDV